MNPAAPDVVGPNEAAVILGVSRQTVYEWATRDGFPPATKLRAGHVWWRADIENYAKGRAAR